MKKNIRLAVAEDHTILRNTMVGMLKKEKGISVVLEAENGKELVDQLSNIPVDVILLDLDMPVMDGREALYLINRSFPKIKVLILSMHCTQLHVEKFISKGAHGYLSKGTDYKDLVKAIKDVAEKDYHYNELVTKNLTDRILINEIQRHQFIEKDPLSEREIQVLKLICTQMSSVEIAKKLDLSTRTVENHRTRLIKKSGVKNTVGLMEYAIQKGYYNLKI